MSQIGPQSRLSILRSSILSNIDTVVLLHVNHVTNITNVFTLFMELADSDSGVDTVISLGAINIAMKVIHHMLHATDIDEDVNDIILHVLQTVQVIVERSTNIMPFFLLASGYNTLMEVWLASSTIASSKIHQTVLSILFRLLQYEEGDEVLKHLSFPRSLLGEEGTLIASSMVSQLWACIRYFVQRHGKLVTSEDLARILNAAVHYGEEFPLDEVFVFHLSWTLFTLTSFGM